MDLENFPVSPSALKMLRAVSNGFYDDSYVGKWIYQVMGAELDATSEKTSTLADQAFLDAATWGLCYWELLVGIPVREDLTYEERRILIRERIDNRHPISPGWLSQYLTKLTGRDCVATWNSGTYTFSVRIGSGSQMFDVAIVKKRLNIVKPAHLSYALYMDLHMDANILVGISTLQQEKRVITTDDAGIEELIWYADRNDLLYADADDNIYIG